MNGDQASVVEALRDIVRELRLIREAIEAQNEYEDEGEESEEDEDFEEEEE